jgi:hypothetical protein
VRAQLWRQQQENPDFKTDNTAAVLFINREEPRMASRRQAFRECRAYFCKPHMPTETPLPGWAYRIRTCESVRELSNWDYVTTSPELGASPAAETLRMQAA